MKPCGQIRQELLEHLYGLLEGENDRALTAHVAECSECQAELAQAQEQMALIAAAAKEEFPQVHFIPPAGDAPLPITRKDFGFRWVAAAAVLLAIGGAAIFGGIYWQRQAQVARAESVLREAKDDVARVESLRSRIIEESSHIKDDFQKEVDQADKDAQIVHDVLMRLSQDYQQKVRQTFAEVNAKQIDLTVIGPRTIEPGASNSFQVLTKTFRQEPLPARINVTVRNQDKREIFKQENVASQGDLVVKLPANLPLKKDSELTLAIEARAEKGQPVVLSETIPLTGPVYVTHLATDRPVYQPGEVVRFRSLTLERFSLRPASEDLELIYTLTSPAGTKTPILRGASQLQRGSKLVLGPDQKPVRGIGAGEFQIDLQAVSGEYTLAVSEARQRFPVQERKFMVLPSGEAVGKKEPSARSAPVDAKKMALEFFPEGGDLVAGVPNRVYFQARSSLDKPAELKGRIVDDAGKEITRVTTFHDSTHAEANQGSGIFEFTPQLGKTYELRIDTPMGLEGRHMLPAVKAEGVVLSIPKGVMTEKDPIRVTIRSVGADRSLLVGAYCRGRLMGHHTVDVKKEEVKEVELGPENGVGGVYRVTVFERVPEPARGERLVPRAERLVYRAPATQLHLAIRPDKASYSPGESVRVGIRATNENGQQQPAIALVAVVDQELLKAADERTYRSMPAHFLLTTEVRRPEDLEHADFFLSDSPQAAKALDLLLGTQGWRRFAEQDPNKFQKEQKQEAQRLLALEGQWPLQSVNYGQEQVQKVVRDFLKRFAELDNRLSLAEDKHALVRKGDAHQEKINELRQETSRFETDRVAALGRASDAKESWSNAAVKFQNYRESLRDVILPILLGVLLLATVANLIRAFVRRSQGRQVRYLAGAACSLLLVALTLYQRTSFLNEETTEGVDVASLGGIDNAVVQIRLDAGTGRPGPLKNQGDKAPGPNGGLLAPIKPNRPQAMDKKEPQSDKIPQPASKREQREMPKVPVYPVPKRDDQQPTPLVDQPLRNPRHLLPQMPIPNPPPPPLVLREYAHLHEGAKAGPDFAPTLYWHPVLVLPDGNAEISFDLCDKANPYQILVVGHTPDGRLAEATAELKINKPSGNQSSGK
ncbi:MAG TPA: hypothetical protein VGX70_09150 [Gemmataceae bacterium]|nr:hypothetical protein [Gemmataceae bacterium]